MGRITRRPPQAKAKLEHECRVGTGGDKWRTHQGELWAAATRIAGAAGWRKTSRFWAFVSVWFDSAEKAAALKAWLQAQQFGHHQASFVPRPEPTAEDIASDRWLAEEWGFATGKVGDVVQAYRRARQDGSTHMPANYAAAEVVRADRPELTMDEARSVAQYLCQWAETHHPRWFWRGIDAGHVLNGY